MVSFVRLVAVILLLAGGLAGCERATAIPPGAQQVHVIASETEIHLNPTTVRAGDVYLVLDVPQRGVELIPQVRTLPAQRVAPQRWIDHLQPVSHVMRPPGTVRCRGDDAYSPHGCGVIRKWDRAMRAIRQD
jgi:hypothetical protein